MKQDSVDFYRKVEIRDLITFKEAALVPPKGYRPDPPRRISEWRCWRSSSGRGGDTRADDAEDVVRALVETRRGIIGEVENNQSPAAGPHGRQVWGSRGAVSLEKGVFRGRRAGGRTGQRRQRRPWRQ